MRRKTKTWRQHRTRWRAMLATSAVLGGLSASFLAVEGFSWLHRPAAGLERRGGCHRGVLARPVQRLDREGVRLTT